MKHRIMVFLVFMVLITQCNSFAQTSKTFVKEILLNKTVFNVGENYTLPTRISVVLSNGQHLPATIKWSGSGKIQFSKPGKYYLSGLLAKYNENKKIQITVVENQKAGFSEPFVTLESELVEKEAIRSYHNQTLVFPNSVPEPISKDKLTQSELDRIQQWYSNFSQSPDIPVKSLAGLEKLRNLEEIQIIVADPELDYYPLTQLKKLKKLTICGIKPEKIKDIFKIESLEELGVYYLAKDSGLMYDDLQGLERLSNLKEFHFDALVNDTSQLELFSKKGSLFWFTHGFEEGKMINDEHKIYKQYSSEKVKQDANLEAVANAIINKLITPGMTDYDKVKAIHNYLIENTDYDYAAYELHKKGLIELIEGTPYEDYTPYNAYGALVKRKAVCNGYAEAFKLLSSKAGIESMVIVGDVCNVGPHAWNLVKLNGEYYHLDATFDDTGGTQSYFLINDSTISSNRTWDTNQYPKCTSNSFSNLHK